MTEAKRSQGGARGRTRARSRAAATAVGPFEPLKRLPAHRGHAALGARFMTEAGWEIPAHYGSADAERAALREGLAVADVTSRGKIDVRGDLSWAKVLAPGHHDEAEIDGMRRAVATMISNAWEMVLTAPGDAEPWLAHLGHLAEQHSLMVTDATHLYAGFVVAGPRATDLLSRLTALNLPEMTPGRCAGTRAAEVSAILVSRELPAMGTGSKPTPLFELYAGSELGRYLWETLVDAGRGLGARPTGWEALRAEGWW